MIADREVSPVGLEGIIGASDDASDIVGMISGGIKISVISDLSRVAHDDIRKEEEGVVTSEHVRLDGGFFRKKILDSISGFDPIISVELHEGVKVRLIKDFGSLFLKFLEKGTIKETLLFEIS